MKSTITIQTDKKRIRAFKKICKDRGLDWKFVMNYLIVEFLANPDFYIDNYFEAKNDKL